MEIIALLGAVLWGLSISLTVWGTWYTLSHLKRDDGHPPRDPWPAISILKPLKGCDAGIPENIESFFNLRYPQFEILFSVADSNDPVVPIVENLIAKYPKVSARLLIGDVDVGPNPKVNNLIRSYHAASFPWLQISDSNTRVDPDFLRRLAPHLDSSVGVVTAVVAGRSGGGIGGRLESAYLNTFFARWMQLASFFGQPFVIGKSMCFLKQTAERFGGIKNLSHYIAEDHMMGQAVQKLGFPVVVMNEPIPQHIGRYPFAAFWGRHIRWGRIRKSQAPIAFFLEPLVTALFSGLVGALSISRLASGTIFLKVFAAHVLLWAACDLLLIRRLETKIGVTTFFSWLVREILALPLWVHMACGSTISWRGSRLRILPGGRVVDPNREHRSLHVIPLGSRYQQSSSRGAQPPQRLVSVGE